MVPNQWQTSGRPEPDQSLTRTNTAAEHPKPALSATHCTLLYSTVLYSHNKHLIFSLLFSHSFVEQQKHESSIAVEWRRKAFNCLTKSAITEISATIVAISHSDQGWCGRCAARLCSSTIKPLLAHIQPSIPFPEVILIRVEFIRVFQEKWCSKSLGPKEALSSAFMPEPEPE